jgi:hypothetical protein
MRLAKTALRVLASTLVVVVGSACISSLNYPEPEQESPEWVGPPRVRRMPTGANPDDDIAKTWSDLTRAARELRQRGELDAAREKLEQAAIQVAPLPPTHVERQTVFGMRARLAEEYARAGELEAADALADQLFAEAEAEPALGGSALAALAVSVADRRERAAEEEGEPTSQLPLYRLALDAVRTGPSSRSRLDLAEDIALRAYAEDDTALARRAIDQAIMDARHVIPSHRERIAQLELLRARIARDQGDLETAEGSATAANAILDDLDADPSTRAIAESLLVEILVAAGDVERAEPIARGARARMDLDQPLNEYAQRRVLAAMARLERRRGDRTAARRHLEQALAVPGSDLEADRALVRELTRELDDEDANAPEEPQASNAEFE